MVRRIFFTPTEVAVGGKIRFELVVTLQAKVGQGDDACTTNLLPFNAVFFSVSLKSLAKNNEHNPKNEICLRDITSYRRHPRKTTMKNHLSASGRLCKAAPAAASVVASRERRMAMTDVTNVLQAGMMTPPIIIRTVKASDDFFFDGIIPSHHQCSPLSLSSSHHSIEKRSPRRRASHRRSHAIDGDVDVAIVSTTQSYPSYDDEDIDNTGLLTRKFEQLHLNTFCKQRRKSRSSDFSSLQTQNYVPSTSSSSIQKLNLSLHSNCIQKQDTASSSGIPSNVLSDLISDLNAKAERLLHEQDEYSTSSLEYSSSDDSIIEAAIYKSVAPLPHPYSVKNQQQLEEGKTIKDLICAICLDFPDDPSHIATVSGCNHRFCFGCIDEWAQKGGKTTNQCPLCKKPFHLVASSNRVRWY